MTSTAYAGNVLATSLIAVFAGSSVNCVAVNVSTKPIAVTGQLFDFTGALVSGSSSPFALSPGHSVGLASGGAGEFYCVFTGPKASMRANLNVTGGAVNTIVSADAR